VPGDNQANFKAEILRQKSKFNSEIQTERKIGKKLDFILEKQTNRKTEGKKL
jgi:hypothetical protein